jgi:hypothetical protein
MHPQNAETWPSIITHLVLHEGCSNYAMLSRVKWFKKRHLELTLRVAQSSTKKNIQISNIFITFL